MKLKNENSKTLSKKTPLTKLEMIYIEKSFSLNKKKFERYVIDYKEYFIITTEKLRSEMITLIIYVYREKKRLRDLIQLKIIIDFKLCRDIKKFEHFEIQA